MFFKEKLDAAEVDRLPFLSLELYSHLFAFENCERGVVYFSGKSSTVTNGSAQNGEKCESKKR